MDLILRYKWLWATWGRTGDDAGAFDYILSKIPRPERMVSRILIEQIYVTTTSFESIPLSTAMSEAFGQIGLCTPPTPFVPSDPGGAFLKNLLISPVDLERSPMAMPSGS